MMRRPPSPPSTIPLDEVDSDDTDSECESCVSKTGEGTRPSLPLAEKKTSPRFVIWFSFLAMTSFLVLFRAFAWNVGKESSSSSSMGASARLGLRHPGAYDDVVSTAAPLTMEEYWLGWNARDLFREKSTDSLSLHDATDVVGFLDPSEWDMRNESQWVNSTLEFLAWERVRLPHHVVFTTSGRKIGLMSKVVRDNAKQAMSRLRRTTVLSFPQIHEKIRKNKYGYPVLSDLFFLAMKYAPHASTYTFFNSDLIFSRGFLNTADALVDASARGKLKSRFLGIGRRHNLAWDTRYPRVADVKFDFDQLFPKGTKFQDDAMDYFITSPTLWDWPVTIPVVVGRLGYDNWMVDFALRDPEISVVDVSVTNPVIHQSLGSNFDGHRGVSAEDKFYNMDLVRRHDPRVTFELGRISNAPCRTRLAEVPRVQHSKYHVVLLACGPPHSVRDSR